MAKHRNVRNAKRVRTLLTQAVQMLPHTMKTGQVYRYASWLFCKRNDGTLATNIGTDSLETCQADHSHWFADCRYAKPVLGVTINL